VPSLTAITTEAAGANCPAGGQRVTTGPDTNTNGVLDAAEVETTTTLCHGSAGATLQWVTVTASSAQAQPNTGYIASSATEVTVTLPATASLQVGDVVRVTGNGSGGWRLAQNAGQAILTGGLPATYRTLDTAFTTLSLVDPSILSPTALVASADGRRLAATGGGTRIAVSGDAGTTWSLRDAARNWTALATSADGVRLVAAETGGTLYTSVDGGLAWTPHGPVARWSSLASSPDGSRLVAGTADGEIYTSTDTGVTWTQRTLLGSPVTSVASSANGSVLFASTLGNGVHRSVDGGTTWNLLLGTVLIRSIAASADGMQLVLAAPWDVLYISIDGGSSWAGRGGVRGWQSVTASADGRRIVAAEASGVLHVSNDRGATWVQRGSTQVWLGVALSSDGSRLAAASSGGTSVGRQDRSTPGTTGAVSGGPDDSLELQYIGGGQFLPTRHAVGSGTFRVD